MQAGKARVMARRKKAITLAMQGDHGPQTAAQRRNTELVPVDGANPNRIYIKRTKNVLKEMHMNRKLSMRQYQAGSEIQEAYAGCEKLSSGSPLKEQVDSTPRPDRFIAAQVDAQSRLERAMRQVTNESRAVIEAVCWHNSTVSVIASGRHHRQQSEILQNTLEKVADVLGY